MVVNAFLFNYRLISARTHTHTHKFSATYFPYHSPPVRSLLGGVVIQIIFSNIIYFSGGVDFWMNDFSKGFDDFGRYFPVGDKFTDKLRNL